MKIKIVTTILLCCTTVFASQEPTTLDKFQTLQKIFASIDYGYPKTATAIGSDHLFVATINSTLEGGILDYHANQDFKFYDIKKYSFDDSTETVLQNETKTQINEEFLFNNWATVTTPPFFLDVLTNDTLIYAQKYCGTYTLFTSNQQKKTVRTRIYDCAESNISITALSCNKNTNTSDMLFGLSNGKIIKINSDNLFNPITLQQPNNNNAITSLHCLSNDKIIFSQDKKLYSLDNANTSNAPQVIDITNKIIEHTAFFEDAVAYCNTNNDITIIFDINHPIDNTLKIDRHQSKINAICLHKKHNTYYLYIGDEEGNLTIWEISSDEKNTTSRVFATIPHTISHRKLSISSLEVSKDDNYIVVKTVVCHNNGTVISNEIISYPTPHMLDGCFKQHITTYKRIHNTFNTQKEKPNNALSLYTLLKNHQSFLLTFPSNNSLKEEIQTNIEKNMHQFYLDAKDPQEKVIEYLTIINKTIGIDFTQGKYELKIGEPLTPFNKTLSQQIINIAMSFLTQQITDQTIRAQIIEQYPLLKKSNEWIQNNNPEYSNIKISKIDYTKTVQPETRFTQQNIAYGIFATLTATFFIALATYLYTLNKK